MALKTWEFKLGEKVIAVKAKKEEAKDFYYDLRSVLQVHQTVRTLSGVIGVTEGWDKESSHTSITLFGPSGVPLADPEGYKADLQKFMDEIPTVFVAGDTLMTIWRKRAEELTKKHVPVKDERRTPEQQAAWRAEIKAADEKRQEEARARKQEEDTQAAELQKQYPFLQSMKASGKSGNAAAASNLKTELQRAFPGVLFSVVSDTYSMGRSLRVHWTDGPTIKQVEEYSGKYGTKSFDGSIDLESDHGGVFNAVFGGVGYTHEDRTISEALYIETAAKLGFEFSPEEWRQFEACAHQDGESTIALQNIRNMAHETSKIPEKPAAVELPAQESGPIDGVTVRMNDERCGVEVLFSAKPERSIIDDLKRHGFRWSPKQKLWYAKQSDSRIAFAKSLQGQEVAA